MKANLYILTIFLLLLSVEALADTFTTENIMGFSTAKGNWNEAKAWDKNSVPTKDDDAQVNDDITVPSGVTAEINNVNIKHRTITVEGTLVIYGNLSMTDLNLMYGKINIKENGTLIVHGNISGQSNSLITVNTKGSFRYYGNEIKTCNITVEKEGENVGKMYSYNRTLMSGNTLTLNGTYDILGDFESQCTIKYGDYGTIGFVGTEHQNIDGNKFTIPKLYMKNPAGVTQNTVITVSSQLFMRSGVLTIKDGCHLEISNNSELSTGSLEITDYNSYIDGLLIRAVRYKTTFIFPVGNGSEAAYMGVKCGNGAYVNGSYKFGVRYHNGKPSIGQESDNYKYLGEGYWEVSNQNGTSSIDAYNSEFRLSDLNIDFLYKNSGGTDGVISALYYCDSYDKNPTWNILGSANLNTNEPLYNGNMILAYNGDNSIKITNEKPLYYAFGIRQDATNQEKTVSSYVTTLESDPQGTWLGKNTNWHDTSNWLSGTCPDGTDEHAFVKDNYCNHVINKTIVTYTDGTKEDITPYETYYHNPVTIFPILSSSDHVDLNQLTIGANSSVTLDGGMMNVLDTISVADGGHLYVNNAYDMSSFLKFGIFSGRVTVNRSFEALRTYYVGSATVEGSVTGLSTPLYSEADKRGDILRLFNPISKKFTDCDHFDITLCSTYNASKKYHDGQAVVTLTQEGRPYNHDGKATHKISLAHKDNCWNIIQNPFLFSLPVDKASTAIQIGESVLKTVWMRGYNSTSKYHFTTYNYGAGVGVTQVGEHSSASTDATSLAPQQGFYLYTLKDDEENFVKFNPDAVTTNLNASLKASQVRDNILRLRISVNGRFSDEMALVFTPDGSVDASSNDSPKMFNTDTYDYGQIYSIKDGSIKNAIAILPPASDMTGSAIPLGIRASSLSGPMTIDAPDIEDFDENIEVYLRDGSNLVDLRSENHSFEATAKSLVEGRFSILLAKNEEKEGNPNIGRDNISDNISIFARDCEISVSAGQQANVFIYDMAGHLVYSTSGRHTITVQIPQGVYIVKVSTACKTKTAKVTL